MPTIISRATWRAVPPRVAPQFVHISDRTEFYVHYEGGTDISKRVATDTLGLVRQWQLMHMDTSDPAHGWNDIGYNYLVVSGGPLDGQIIEGRGRDAAGAHCPGHNVSAIGVQVMLGGDEDASKAALASVRWLYDRFSTDAGHALVKGGHRDGYATACPGDKLYAWVKKGMPSDKPTLPPIKPVKGSASPAPALSGVLRQGDKGSTVLALQKRLQARGWRITADGLFGGATESSVRKFQEEKGLAVDGVVGPKTWAALWSDKNIT